MCGIVGIVPRQPANPTELNRLVRLMAGAVVHRGPDDAGFFVRPDIALGIRRLSIIDVEGGAQPIMLDDGCATIVMNGEIYNYRTLRRELEERGQRFKTASDTEVALHAWRVWGQAGLDRLEGMFGLAIWNAREHRLTIARDWLGQKSIYYAETPLGFVFASEIKGLLALGTIPRELDLETLSHYMSLRYLPGDRTLFAGIRKIPPAHAVDVSATERTFQRLWTPAYAPKWRASEAEALDALDHLMREVVAEHLMSEVPLGAFLSGGIDSSLVVAYAAKASREPLRTFSVGVDLDSQNELPWARRVATQYHTRHHERVMQPDLARLAPRMTKALEEPVDPFAAGVYVVSEVTAEQVTVALGGDGGDELFAGYDRYLGQELAERYSQIPAPLRRHVLRPLIGLVPESFGYKSFATKLRWLDQVADETGVERYAESAAFLRFPHTLKQALFTDAVWQRIGPNESERLLAEYFGNGSPAALVDKMLHADCSTRLAEHQLPIVDRMAMAHSLEARNPFLDRRVAEFAMRLPAEWKMKSRRIKYVTRKLGERYLPHDLLYRKKQGFGFPLGLWFRSELRHLIEQVAETSRLAEHGIFRREEMRRLVGEHVTGRVDHSYRLWLLFTLEVWYRHYIQGEPVDMLEALIDEHLSLRG
ncbi:MAG TPA: asparagine synthase (glutamine-hydrolyzing) [Gemmatimonadaceae bacterium]|nr:asparagine synthase (glutamine-hydrolyzing) [Gemmatimonadaceae bacterium]